MPCMSRVIPRMLIVSRGRPGSSFTCLLLCHRVHVKLALHVPVRSRAVLLTATLGRAVGWACLASPPNKGLRGCAYAVGVDGSAVRLGLVYFFGIFISERCGFIQYY
jgi:hypothetical protein